jgi:hypothetical protein
MSDISLKELIEAWRTITVDVKAREARFKESIAEDKLLTQQLQAEIVSRLVKEGLTKSGIKGDNPNLIGTAYIIPKTSSKVEDPEAFFNFVFENRATEFLYARANEEAVSEYIEDHASLPPGVTRNTFNTLGFRKSS